MHKIFGFPIHYEYFASFHFMKKKVEIEFKMHVFTSPIIYMFPRKQDFNYVYGKEKNSYIYFFVIFFTWMLCLDFRF